MTAGAPPLASARTIRRDLLAPAVERAVASLRLPAGAWVLDAGTGYGGALPALARAIGSAGTIRAVDIDANVLGPAEAYAARHGVAGRVSLARADLVEVVDGAATDPHGGFDAVWVGGAVRPGNFADPAAAVAAIGRALRPGGVLALFSCDRQQAVFLPGHARLERLVRAAAELRHGVDRQPRHDLHLAWLRAADLTSLTLEVFPRVGLRIGDDRSATAYLETTVWPDMLESATARGRQVGMTAEDLRELRELVTPGAPRYVLDDPAHYVVAPTVLVAARRARSGRR